MRKVWLKTVLCLGMIGSCSWAEESLDETMEGFDDAAAVQQTVPAKKAAESDDLMAGFDDESGSADEKGNVKDASMEAFEDEEEAFDTDGGSTSKKSTFLPEGLSGELTQQFAFSYNKDKPKNLFSSLRQTLFLDYEHTFENGVKFKINAKAFYDGMYDVRKTDYTQEELDSLRTEIRLYDAYLEWSFNDHFDAKAGRQVVVWGRSDTIRITDVLNPLDNRRPGIVDIEDLRLPTTMLRFDYSIGDWRITPIVILEQQFTLNPPYGSIYNPLPYDAELYREYGLRLPYIPQQERYRDPTFAVSIGGEFPGWDISFYAAHIYDDIGYLKAQSNIFFQPGVKIYHDKVNMFGTALNVLSGSWLFKTEWAYWDKLRFTAANDKTFNRIDGLVGFEYSGISETTISYDIAVRHFMEYDDRLGVKSMPNPLYPAYSSESTIPLAPIEKNTYQHAFRIRSNFMNDTLHLNYLHTRYGLGLEKGGFQRAWIKYDIADAINTEVGVVDYFGGTPLFDEVKDEMLFFMDISYSF